MTTAVATGVAMLVLTVVLQVVLAQTSRSSIDRVLEDRAEAVVSTVVQASDDDEIEVPRSAVDVGVVVWDEQGRRVAGEPPPGAGARYEALARVVERTYSTAGGLRLLAEPFRTVDGRDGVVVVPERLEPYRQAERYALLVSLVTGAVATGAAAAVAAVVMARALRPVGQMARTARDWSQTDLSRRFDLGPPTTEITSLGAVLDTLLERVAQAIRSEQRVTSELAHELRTPLTALQGTVDLCLLRGDLPPAVREELEEIATTSRRMATTITALLEGARSGPRVDASCAVGDAVTEVLAPVRRDRPDLRVHQVVADLDVRLSHDVLVRVLSPLVDNAVRFSSGTVTVTGVAGGPGRVELLVEDDGPGVSPDDVGRVFTPGVTTAGGSGAGLGLALSRRLARAAGGDVDLPRPAGPTRFRVDLPRA